MPEQSIADLLIEQLFKTVSRSHLWHYINMILELGVKSLRLSSCETLDSLSFFLSLIFLSKAKWLE